MCGAGDRLREDEREVAADCTAFSDTFASPDTKLYGMIDSVHGMDNNSPGGSNCQPTLKTDS